MAVNLMHLYTGDGKGKTTAAMGLALRMLGHNKRVLIAQFMKDGNSSELKALNRFNDQVILFDGLMMKGFFRARTPDDLKEKQEEYGQAITQLKELIHEKQPELTILDELNVAIVMQLVSVEDALDLIDTALLFGDAVVTGRYAPQRMIDKADYVSRIEAVKHPFDQGQKAREGIEF
ncbi:MAG: cob(I)yrinic acid a,c-diamide adenosyltransferase [Bacillota bacterium]|nr:cob(I)yrinic acid a,c-diamide adenosyltransferase [Bacillota bacterium]